MPISDERLEQIEQEYFNQLYYYLKSNQQRMMEGLESKNLIKDDWWDQFVAGAEIKQISDVARGAERIFYWLLTTLWIPNSSPIGSDLFFESHNAFIHIDIKTAKSNNTSDYKGKVAVGKNQISYESNKTHTGRVTAVNPNLPQYYNEGKTNEKVCLTYVIQMIHDPDTLDIIAIILISIPNGQLYSVYENRIVGAGKNKNESMRYEYKNAPTFEKLSNSNYRIKFLYFNTDYPFSKKDITTLDEIN